MPHVNGLVAYSDASHAPGEGVAAVAAVVRGPEGLEARAQVLLAARGSTEAERAASVLARKLALLAAGLAGHAPVPPLLFPRLNPLASWLAMALPPEAPAAQQQKSYTKACGAHAG